MFALSVLRLLTADVSLYNSLKARSDSRSFCEKGYYRHSSFVFIWTMSFETVALLSKLNVDKHIDVEIKIDELDLTIAESKATYAEIKEYVWNEFGLKVPTLYIAQIKKKCGIERVL